MCKNAESRGVLMVSQYVRQSRIYAVSAVGLKLITSKCFDNLQILFGGGGIFGIMSTKAEALFAERER